MKKIDDGSVMNFDVPKTPGIYSLVIDVRQDMAIPVGAMGTLCFSRGYYIYTGSARGKASMNLHTRIRRHLQDKKKQRWHIDYLLKHKATILRNAFYCETFEDLECGITQSIIKYPSVFPVHKGFGASDCRNRCYSHLSQFEHSDLETLMHYLSDVYHALGTSYQIARNLDDEYE
jgi:Uri superfamily endonuclease